MAEISADTSPIERREDVDTNDPASKAGFWLSQLTLAEKESKEFIDKGRKIVKRYRDERRANSKSSKFNILWANVETLKPILYGRTPKPDVERRHKNGDAVARLGAQILERALAYEDDLDEFDEVMDQVVEDLLLPGRGIARIYYGPEFGEPENDPDATPEDGEEAPKFQPVTSERAPVRYVFWEDYRESPARKAFHEVWWVAYRSYMPREELVNRFGKDIGNAITLDYAPKESDKDKGGPMPDAFKKAEVWEIWDKSKKEAVWVAPSYSAQTLDCKPDPLGLPGFFPSPNPVFATTTNDSRQPIADYIQYQDQATELDVLTARIDRLTSALKVSGLYAGVQKAELQRLVDASENELIPVEDWAAFMDRTGGDLSKLIVWMPIEQIAAVLIRLYDARDRVQRTLYQITGMADILRGETDPNETLGAQQLKSQFATRRITKAQKKVARFARDLMRLRGFVLARRFQAETLAEMTGLPEPMPPMPPAPPQMIPAPPQAPASMLGHNGGPPMGMGA